jgi:hypothetical protein
MAGVDFWTFYNTVFLKEHHHPWNALFHVSGTLLGWAVVPVVFLLRASWLYLLLTPVLLIVPGQIGHRIWERNGDVGDVRVFRSDFPGIWFLFGNHVMAYNYLTGQHRPFQAPKE